MHLLLVNDDGIHAPGIRQLAEEAIRQGHEVTVCAPYEEQSGKAHAFTIWQPLRVVRDDTYPLARAAYAVYGTPSDCARLGLYICAQEHAPVDLVISGVNRGANLGDASVYSGTVNAALEGAMAGCTSIATSLTDPNATDYTAAAVTTLRFARWALAHPLPHGVAYNLNVPNRPLAKIRGFRQGKLAAQFQNTPRYIQMDAPEGEMLYQLHDIISTEFTDEYDAELINQGYATVTPMTWDMDARIPLELDAL